MVRVLLCGDVRGNLEKLCSSINKLHARLDQAQHFEVVFCVGEFSSEQIHWDVEPPIPVFFIDCGPKAKELIETSPNGKELSKGIHFLGSFGVSTIAGLKVAFLSGRRRTVEDVDPMAMAVAAEPGRGPSWEEIRAMEKKQAYEKTQFFIDGGYTSLALEKLHDQIAEAGGIDLLLTSEWPEGILRGLKAAWPEEAAMRKRVKVAAKHCSSSGVAEIAAVAEPKYHAVGLAGLFWRRPPWQHERRGEVVVSSGELRGGVCRLLSLGAADGSSPGVRAEVQVQGPDAAAAGQGGQASKPEKWIHGLDLDPTAMPATADDATLCPWSEKAKAMEAAEAEARAKQAATPARIAFDEMDAQERKRWKAHFGCLPEEMQGASDKIAKESAPKEKKPFHKSLYKVSEKEKKRRKTGGDGHLPFSAKERMQAR